ncbi:hypothetical protein [Ruegeria sp. R14_0]|uniref:hypothetical protein n=1 Tax=Ruegeria sp. R14_0 TaxID=2821100 RepID=UPI001ADAAE30|nr:hypothetical protein [Ruegeria sp. R14_0]MBO9448337.1 hypothetical protein [Ruegeria sp. R14_0]
MTALNATQPTVFDMLAAVILTPFAVLLGLTMLGFAFGLTLMAVCHAVVMGKRLEGENHKAPLSTI